MRLRGGGGEPMGGRGGGGCLCLRWGGLGPGSQCGHCRSSVPARGPSRQHPHSDIRQRDHCLRLSLNLSRFCGLSNLITTRQRVFNFNTLFNMYDMRSRSLVWQLPKNIRFKGWCMIYVIGELSMDGHWLQFITSLTSLIECAKAFGLCLSSMIGFACLWLSAWALYNGPYLQELFWLRKHPNKSQ